MWQWKLQHLQKDSTGIVPHTHQQAATVSPKTVNQRMYVGPLHIKQPAEHLLQELMKYQRSIEAAMHQGWQSKLGNSRDRANVHPKPKHGGESRAGMLREDSAYEMYSGYRNAIKVVSQLWAHLSACVGVSRAAARHSHMVFTWLPAW